MILRAIIAALVFFVTSSTAPAHEGHVVKLVAGSPGYDHIQPFMAEKLGFWDKYGVKVNFVGGNYIRSNNMMSIGDFDAGYNQFANAIRYHVAGIPNIIVGSSSANCAIIIANKDIKSWQDLKGKRIGIVTKFDVQYMTLIEHILPRFGLSPKDVELAMAPVPEIAAAIITGSVAAAFPFEPFGTDATTKGAKILLDAHEMIDKSKIQSDMLRNGLVMQKQFIKDHPDLAKKIMWAHMDAVEVMRKDKKVGVDVLAHYNPKMDRKLIEAAYDRCGWQYQKPPKVWIEILIAWMKKHDVIQKTATYEEVTDFSLQDGYPGYPGWEKKKAARD